MTKPNINEIIKSPRKLKRLTQQELADEAGVSLRTVQRIEKGTEEINGFSLKQISKVLDIPLEELIMQNVDQVSIDNNQIGSIRNLYLSSLFFVFNPILGLLVPYIYGYCKRNRSKLYNIHLKKNTKYHGFYLLFIALILIILIFSFHLNDSSNPYITESTSPYITDTTTISYALFFWQLFILFIILYIPISLIWTFLQFRKLIKSLSQTI